MISVVILINGQPIMARAAVNTGCKPMEPPKIGEPESGEIMYRVDDGSFVNHNPDDGAVPLAIKLLQTIQEPRESPDAR